MTVRTSMAKYKEFEKYLEQYEAVHGVQDVNGIRILARTFAGRYSPLDNKAVQPLYSCLFMTACNKRNIPIPDDFNENNFYDPDGLYPDDTDIQRKMRRNELKIQRFCREIQQLNEENRTT